MTEQRRAPRADVYRAHWDAPRSPVGRGSEAVCDPLRGRVDVLSQVEAVAFGGCQRWATLDEHAARVTEGGAGATQGAIRGILGELAGRGVLLSEAELGAMLARVATEEAAPRIGTLGVPTRDRPASLRRALESYAADIAASGRDIDILVIDDALTDEAAGRGRAVARDVAERLGVSIRFSDRRDKARFTEEIARLSGAPLEVVHSALAPEDLSTFAAGAARNLLLLDSAGQCSLQIDDDTRCELRQAPEARAGLRAHSIDDPTEFWFDEDAVAAGKPFTGYAALHERLLGQRASALTLAAFAGEGADLGAASTALLRRMTAGGRVLCTQLGIYGDSALGAMGYLLTLARASRERLVASEAKYRRAIETRRVVRAAPAATLTEQDLCMTYAIGLDGRTPLPPFPALDRNEDGLFGTVLAACDPNVVFGHLPWMVVHEPEDVRLAGFDYVLEQVGRVGVDDLIAGLVTLSRPELNLRSPTAAFESLGRCLMAWSQVPENELFERLSWMLARRLANRLGRGDTLLRESRRKPLFWAYDIDLLADTLRERAEEPERAVPFELRERHDPRKARALAIERVRSHGEMLVCWPAIWEAARVLRERGVRLGEVAT